MTEHGQATTEHGQATTRIVAGIGFASTAPAAEIFCLVSRCLAGRQAALLALPRARAHLPQGCEAAELLGLPVVAVLPGAMARVQDRCPTPSARAGLAVAEGAALAAAGPGARLLVPRVAASRVTCALAVDDAAPHDAA